MPKFPKFILIFSFLFLPFLVLAVQLESPISSSNVYEIARSILSWLFWISIPLVTIIAIWAGFVFMSGGGEPEKIKKAKGILLYVVIGFTVILLSNGIVSWVGDILGIKTEIAKEGEIQKTPGATYIPADTATEEDSFESEDALPVSEGEVPSQALDTAPIPADTATEEDLLAEEDSFESEDVLPVSEGEVPPPPSE